MHTPYAEWFRQHFAELQSHWLINGQAQCENVQPDNGGLSQCTVIFGLNDTDITLEVFDPSGAAASDNVTISVEATEAPTAEITSPLVQRHNTQRKPPY